MVLRQLWASVWRPLRAVGFQGQRQLAVKKDDSHNPFLSLKQTYAVPSATLMLGFLRKALLHPKSYAIPVSEMRSPLFSGNSVLRALRALFPQMSARLRSSSGVDASILLRYNKLQPAFTGRFYGTFQPGIFRNASTFSKPGLRSHLNLNGSATVRPVFMRNGAAGGSRGYSTGFAQTAFNSGGQQAFTSNLSNALVAFKVLPGAIADEATFQKQSPDSLKSRLQARAVPNRRNRKPIGVRTSKRGVAIKPVVKGEARPVSKPTAPAESTPSVLAAKPTPPTFRQSNSTERVRMSFCLYGPPAWEIDSVAPGLTNALGPQIVSELRHVADIHQRHLSFVATVLEKMHAYGFQQLLVDETTGGMYELGIDFPVGVPKLEIVDFLLVAGIDPCSPHFRLRTLRLDSVPSADTNELSKNSMNQSPAQVVTVDECQVPNAKAPPLLNSSGAFEFPCAGAHRPPLGTEKGDAPCGSVQDFIAMVETLRADGDILGSRIETKNKV
ncbi:hypothetical protein HDU85_002734 [Gaertneriomyces sp. JEL0708]|nr:hypothetical protein HDU85_002734 [Gaertneriomyces sp. JEL0708]